MNAILDAGYLYELAGLIFYVFFLTMTRRANAAKYSPRSRILTIAAAIVLVGSALLHYATKPAGVAAMLVLAVASLGSAYLDVRRR
ncbi:MAG: hypothetical protein NVSMB64_28600 [Candidatus Velthaea sp.]